MNNFHLALFWHFISDPFLKVCKARILWEKLGTLYYMAKLSIIFLYWRGERNIDGVTYSVTPQAQTFMNKYTNPARGILDFCKQKFYRPLLCSLRALSSMYTQCYEVTTFHTTPRTLSNTLRTLRNKQDIVQHTQPVMHDSGSLHNTRGTLRNTPRTCSIMSNPQDIDMPLGKAATQRICCFSWGRKSNNSGSVEKKKNRYKP